MTSFSSLAPNRYDARELNPTPPMEGARGDLEGLVPANFDLLRGAQLQLAVDGSHDGVLGRLQSLGRGAEGVLQLLLDLVGLGEGIERRRLRPRRGPPPPRALIPAAPDQVRDLPPQLLDGLGKLRGQGRDPLQVGPRRRSHGPEGVDELGMALPEAIPPDGADGDADVDGQVGILEGPLEVADAGLGSQVHVEEGLVQAPLPRRGPGRAA